MRYKHLLGKELKDADGIDVEKENTIFISGIDYKIGISLSKLDGEGNLFCLTPKYRDKHAPNPSTLYIEYKEAFKILTKQFIGGYYSQGELKKKLGSLSTNDSWGCDPTKSCPFK